MPTAAAGRKGSFGDLRGVDALGRPLTTITSFFEGAGDRLYSRAIPSSPARCPARAWSVSSWGARPWSVAMRELPAINLTLVSEALQGFLSEELRASGQKRYVLGLSGGLDSALAAALAVRALGPERLEAVALPGPTSSAASLEHARLVAEKLQVRLEVVDLAETGRLAAATLGIGEDRRLRFGTSWPGCAWSPYSTAPAAPGTGARPPARRDLARLLHALRGLRGLGAGARGRLEDASSSSNSSGCKEVVDKPPTADLCGPDRCRRDGVRLSRGRRCCTGTTRAA